MVAFYYHPALDVARAQWGVAQAGIITAGGHPEPGVSFFPEYVSNAPASLSPWILGFSFDLDIETAGKRGYRIDTAVRLSEAARLNIANTAWQVRGRLRTSLLFLYRAARAESIMENQRSILEDIVQLFEERLATGEVSRPDVSQARILLDQTYLLLCEVQKQRAEARVELANALGLTINALGAANLSFDLFHDLPLLTNLPLKALRRQALTNRSDILTALAKYAARQSALQLEIAKQFPDIHLGPGYSWEQGDNRWALGLSFLLPIFNRNRGPITEAAARRKEAEVRFNEVQATVIGDIDRAIAAYQAAVQKLEAADSLLLARKNRLLSFEAMFEAGETDRLDLLSAQLEHSLSELSRLEAYVSAEESLGLLEGAIERPINSSESAPPALERDPRKREEK